MILLTNIKQFNAISINVYLGLLEQVVQTAEKQLHYAFGKHNDQY